MFFGDACSGPGFQEITEVDESATVHTICSADPYSHRDCRSAMVISFPGRLNARPSRVQSLSVRPPPTLIARYREARTVRKPAQGRQRNPAQPLHDAAPHEMIK